MTTFHPRVTVAPIGGRAGFLTVGDGSGAVHRRVRRAAAGDQLRLAQPFQLSKDAKHFVGQIRIYYKSGSNAESRDFEHSVKFVGTDSYNGCAAWASGRSLRTSAQLVEQVRADKA